MGDFHQTETISTLHRLKKDNVDQLEEQLNEFVQSRPIALVLPCLYSELQRAALKNILENLKDVTYLNEIVITIGRADEDQFKHAQEYFSVLPQNYKLIWDDGEKIQSLFNLLKENGLDVGEPGKGRAAWIAYGYVLAREESEVIALHDCDVLTYNRELLARLCYPLANPNMDYEFCKGYYPRVTDRLYGRVTRLFISPIIRALKKIVGHMPFLVYLDSFRYPLAGEFSMKADLARINRIPADWGLEVGSLAEVFRNVSMKRICQVDLADNYEHKHQDVSAHDADSGLLKMCTDISTSLFTTLSSEGVQFSESLFNTLFVTYLRIAQDSIKMYNDDAAINGLFFDRHAEGLAVETFVQGIRIASQKFLEDPLGSPLIPNWSRVTSAIPDFLDQLELAVEEDNA
ncbi:MAG: glycosyl transferase [Candidatus Dadabacteria bacterium]|jgi:glucosyl-3-phosphoglycerate synthase|nr:glycosyl transferase [Bacteroidota bacterium]MCZ6468573.1 glycosyl transferase [Candidatus Dadabacteria bacterium]MCZ6684963.1 glycosyl transferase [Candidatus Dadabacteria bacterium]MCZ6790785.1 glycosyl transferase [Candidatus Dadabacteria bacterium]MCZ6864107.1 glycosyl transferase [Candidatus Dadabacteria bacterium]